ncbi:U2AF motif kinase 1 [Crotalus adamanteus]|uniref:U2AF motif kinase 1 n=1 Tax=Crotalus adamanteus TaxID=8729 RepID=A0AAW1BPW5_CROAD
MFTETFQSYWCACANSVASRREAGPDETKAGALSRRHGGGCRLLRGWWMGMALLRSEGSGLLALGDDVDYGFSNERAALEELRGHRNIVTLYSVFTNCSSAKGPSYCLLLELLDISVSELLVHSSQPGCSMWITQHCACDVLEALIYLHHKGYVHADLKPRNILWSAEEECFKLIDFGLSFKEEKSDVKYIQTDGYQAPETELQNCLSKTGLHGMEAPHIEDLVMLPTPVLRLLNILSDASLQNEEEFEVDDIREECSKYGQIVSLFVPKESLGKGHVLRMMASKSAAMFVNLGMFILLNTVFVEYAYAGDSKAAQRALTGKRFNGKFVVATF